MQPIRVEQISIEHASRELLMNKGISAPKDFSVIGEVFILFYRVDILVLGGAEDFSDLDATCCSCLCP